MICVSIIFKDDLGRSHVFNDDRSGYQAAQSTLDSLRAQGRTIADGLHDVARVERYTGGEERKSTFPWF